MDWKYITLFYCGIVLICLLILDAKIKDLFKVWTPYRQSFIIAFLDATCDLAGIMTIPVILDKSLDYLVLIIIVILLFCLYILREYIKVNLKHIQSNKQITHANDVITSFDYFKSLWHKYFFK